MRNTGLRNTKMLELLGKIKARIALGGPKGNLRCGHWLQTVFAFGDILVEGIEKQRVAEAEVDAFVNRRAGQDLPFKGLLLPPSWLR
jgi:hypothetical protein